MPARKRKRRRPPEPRQPRRVPTQNRLPPADSSNLKARSFSTWPFSSRGHRFFRADAFVIPRRLGRGTSHLVTRNGMFTPAPQSVALPETTTSAIGRARLCRARSHDEHIGGALSTAAALCHFPRKQLRSRCGNCWTPDFARAIECNRIWQ